MKLIQGKAPFYRREQTVITMMDDVAACLAALLVLPVLYYGPRPLFSAAAGCLGGFFAQVLFCLLQRQRISVSQRSVLVTGLTAALLLPGDVDLYIPALAAAFGIFVVREPFGSLGRNTFNPAAAGVAFVTVLWPEKVFRFPGVDFLPLWGEGVAASRVEDPMSMLQQGLIPLLRPVDMLLGRYAGPLGSTAALVICGCGLFLFFRRTARWEITAGFLLSAAAVAFFFPRAPYAPEISVAYELLTGSLLFAGVFMMTDPVTSPRMAGPRFVYGLLGGGLAMLLRHVGAYEEGVCFAVLLSNAAAPLLDRAGLWIRTKGVVFRGKTFRAR